MAKTRKFYVVWEGRAPGIYDSWDECKAQVDGFEGAKYKAFVTQEEATAAFRGSAEESLGFFKALSQHNISQRAHNKNMPLDLAAHPEINPMAWAVDAACAHNPGPVEYQGVLVATGQRIFHFGPLAGGTNNIGEFLAIVHAAALLRQRGDTTTPIYSDSRTAISWIRNRRHKSMLEPNAQNTRVFQLLDRAQKYLQTYPIPNPILKWQTEQWGEIPADFGRKR